MGPLLFIIYTSDLSSCLPLECKLFMYADDSTITYSSSNINEIENNLNTALGRIYDWCFRNKLTINANKTKSMLIGSKQKVCNTDLNVSIAGSSVVQVNYVKCLGVIIDESLSWGPHVEYVKKTVSSNLGMLEKIQRRATKLIPELRYLRYEERLKECGLTTLETRRLRGDQIEVFKILNGYENIDSNIFFEIKKSKITRGHNFTLVKKQSTVTPRYNTVARVHKFKIAL